MLKLTVLWGFKKINKKSIFISLVEYFDNYSPVVFYLLEFMFLIAHEQKSEKEQNEVKMKKNVLSLGNFF